FEELAVEAGSGGASRDTVHGLHAHFVLMHIEALIQHTTLLKSHNKAGSGGASRDAVHGLHARFALMHIEALLDYCFLFIFCYFLLGA
ncbi:hypothetical protein, partial [Listeria rocourtiae]|uniref:hypothetical protein n=1 Tax=Listeria rocourtiae TaxID=647910 RepID=UPI0003E84932